MSAISVQPLTTVEEFREALALQQAIWGFSDAELLPARMFVVASKIGGQVLGAFDGARMIGFCVAMPGLKPGGGGFLHSHMLKLEQRQDALARGVDLVEWTFDPLELKNAYFNLERLGAIVRRYVPNQYGITASPLHGGLPTDRLVAEWWLGTRWVETTLSGERVRPPVERRIEVPADIERLRREAPKQAREIQKAAGESFAECFERGLAVIGFERAGTYLLGRWDSE